MYDVRGFLGEPGVTARFQRVKLDAVVYPEAGTTITPQQLDELVTLAAERCPVAVLYSDAGVHMKVSYKLA
jgi:hypothetical protein